MASNAASRTAAASAGQCASCFHRSYDMLQPYKNMLNLCLWQKSLVASRSPCLATHQVAYIHVSFRVHSLSQFGVKIYSYTASECYDHSTTKAQLTIYNTSTLVYESFFNGEEGMKKYLNLIYKKNVLSNALWLK